MAREKRAKGKKGKGTRSDRQVEVQLAPTIAFLHEHLSEALCQEVFEDVREHERQRKWSLFALARFWLAVILSAPPSLSHLLETMRGKDPRGFLPEVAASAESFFQKCKSFSSGFFMALYQRFIDQVLPAAPASYCHELQHLREKFSDVVAIDGSRLDRIAHRLKILRAEKAVVLPSCLLAVYDIFRGVATQLWFDADAAASEFRRALLAVDGLGAGTLVLGDRLYCSTALFQRLEQNRCYGLFWRAKSLSIEKVRRVDRRRVAGQLVEDWRVVAGKNGNETDLRLIVLKANGKTYEVLTNVLAPENLSVEDALSLYPLRWRIERLFYDLKVVLNVKKLYAANPNAAAMQVFAAALVHVAFRIAQADIAKTHGLSPEELSPQKLFPYLSLTSIKLLEGEYSFDRTQEANPDVDLQKPPWRDVPGTVVSLRQIKVQR